jgi:hypothetical protein
MPDAMRAADWKRLMLETVFCIAAMLGPMAALRNHRSPARYSSKAFGWRASILQCRALAKTKR